MVRLYCLSYIPSGLFSRLIARILSDNIVKSCLSKIFEPDYSNINVDFLKNTEPNNNTLRLLIDFICQKAEWKCWQTGIELNYLGFTFMSVKQLLSDPISARDIYTANPVMYRDCENEIQLKMSGRKCSFVECYCSLRDLSVRGRLGEEVLLKVLCDRKVIVKLFALVIEIIDSLLEDWFPDLGTKFMQDSKGQYLVTRLSPCIECLERAECRLQENADLNVTRDV